MPSVAPNRQSATSPSEWLGCNPGWLGLIFEDDVDGAVEVSQVFFRLSGWENLDYAEEI